jgi:hypothetical protein
MSQTSTSPQTSCGPHSRRSFASRRNFLAALIGSAVVAIGFAVFAHFAFAGSSINVYNNSLQTSDGRKEIKQVKGKGSCDRGGSARSFRTELGKKTSECAYRVPYVGRDLSVSATARLFESTPKKVAKRTYLALNLRQASDGSRYQLAVYPVTGKFQVRKIYPSGNIKVVDHGNKRNTIGKLGEKNRMAFRAYNGDGGPDGTARLIAIINGKKVSVVDDSHGNQLSGEDTTFSIAAKNGARGAKGSFIDISVGLPNPF